MHLYAGEEASAVGVCMHLGDTDTIASTHRGHGHCIAKGCDVGAMMNEIYGRKDGLCGGKGGSMHIADLSKGMLGANGIVGGGPPLICGAALTAKVMKTGGVAVAFLGDGASNQGTTLESYNLASVWNLPAVFVVEDNGYAEATSSSYAVAGSQVERAADLVWRRRKWTGSTSSPSTMRRATAIARARAGEGPSLIHLRLTRYYGHFEGDAMTYRAARRGGAPAGGEATACSGFEQRVTEAALLEANDLDAVDRNVAEEESIAPCANAKSAAPPADADLLTDVYVAY